MNLPGSPSMKFGKHPLPLLVSGTLSEITNPFPSFGEQVQTRRKPAPVGLSETPIQMVKKKKPVDLFKNRQPAPGTKPRYGMPGMGGAF
jgi:hypothetical protein